MLHRISHVARPLIACLAVASAGPLQAAVTVTLEADGVAIQTPSDGRFVLTYPMLLDSSNKTIKPAAATVDKRGASMTYPGGGQVSVRLDGDAVALHFTALPDNAKGLRMDMTVPIALADGGKWQMEGEEAKPFPAKAGEQFVFKGNPKPVKLIGPKGGAFTLAMPHGWQQVQDNRLWKTNNFGYMLSAQIPREPSGEAYYTFSIGTGQKRPAAKRPQAPAPVRPKAKPGLSMRLAGDGLAIEVGGMGHFTLHYPVLVGERWDQVRKPIERRVNGNTATIRFDEGATIEVALNAAAGELTLTPSHLPGDAKSIRQEMLIDFHYANGGTWKIGDRAETPFPTQKPEKPFLFQDHAERFTLTDAEGSSLTIQSPPLAYQQLTDNREWGWKVFFWQFSVPITGQGPLKVKVSFAAPTGGPKILVDRFGQNARATFPDKVQSEADLKGDVQAEADYLASLKPPAADRFGGLPGSREKLGLQATGFFHVEKKGPRWLLVDPEGNAFFHLGLCGFNPSDDYTYVEGREQVYEWLPPREGALQTAWHQNAYWQPRAVSFQLANMIRKTGHPYTSAEYTTRMIERVRKWGFNSAGAFGSGDVAVRKELNFPAVASLPLSTWEGITELPGAQRAIDPFDPAIRQRCDKNFAAHIAPRADDPLIIGYFLTNEPLYEDLPKTVPTLDGKHACKQRLARMLEEKYKTIAAFNAGWETSLASFTEVAERGLPVKTSAARADMHEFTGLFLEAYFQLIADTFHKYDKHHMLIGNRLQSGTINNEQLCRLSGKYLDVVSFNYYTYDLDRDLLARIQQWTGGRPMFFSEFYFSSPSDSGLPGGGKDVGSQLERGLAYRHYVEQAAALGYVVGIEWFTLVDQSFTGRYFEKYSGENANTGLISVADRPWKPMLGEMMKTNYDIYRVQLGECEPFRFDNPRFQPPKQADK